MTDFLYKETCRQGFWENLALNELNRHEWEALCDGCGLCCLLKFEYVDENSRKQGVTYTKIACKLLDCETCRCKHYEARKKIVSDCIQLDMNKIDEIAHWMPPTCAYRLRYENKQLFDWHYLKSGDRESVHAAGISARGLAISETKVSPDDVESFAIEVGQG